MAEPTHSAWLARISATGLTVSDAPAPDDAPSVEEAWQSVINWEVEPVAKIPLTHPRALQEADRQWRAHALDEDLFSADGSFLLSISGTGSWSFGWAMVKWAPGVGLSARLVNRGEVLNFVAMSLDGKSVCAVTEEDDDYWIVVQHLR
ncbi:hypothetical protein [Streptomyces sp. NPDC002185]|uniref:hypothetical protein n=1 Tax=Streptomyces sp. NPDC002185 TaxID=3364636 RepID=UPI0036A5210A